MAIAFGALAIPLRMSCRFDRNSGEAIVDRKIDGDIPPELSILDYRR